MVVRVIICLVLMVVMSHNPVEPMTPTNQEQVVGKVLGFGQGAYLQHMEITFTGR